MASIALPLLTFKTVDVPLMPGVEVPGSRVPNESWVTAMASEGVAHVADSHPAAPAVVDVAVVKGPVVMNIHVDMSVPPADRPPPGRPESVARKPEREPAGNGSLDTGKNIKPIYFNLIGVARTCPENVTDATVILPRSIDTSLLSFAILNKLVSIETGQD